MNLLQSLCAYPFLRRRLAAWLQPQDRESEVFGLRFKNPIGLGAGFDKNARWLREWETLGFGFVEIGTVTPKPQEGNEKPRLFRLPKDRALVNRMGFNNEGVDAIIKRLKEWREGKERETDRERRDQQPLLIGGNIGKNKSTPNEEAWKDYSHCFRALHPYVDFFVVNVSSPNTPGLRALQEKDALKIILTGLQALNRQHAIRRPILLKIAPDLTSEQIQDVIDLALEIRLDGFVATNTTVSREGLRTGERTVEAIGAGGLSGLPLKESSTRVLKLLQQKAPGIPVIGSGGIFNAEDARQKMASGAQLVEVWTGFIYEGPKIVKNICTGLMN